MVTLSVGDVVRFNRGSKYSWDYKKNDTGVIDRVLVAYPYATDNIYLVRLSSSGNIVWAVDNDVTLWNQLQLAV